MSLDITNNIPLRHLATFSSTGTFLVPEGITKLFLSVQGASGGGSSGFNHAENGHGSTGGLGVWGGAWANVAPGQSYPIIIGSGGAGTSGAGNSRVGTAGGSGGTTSFDNTVLAAGGAGANAGSHHSPGGASPGASGSTSYETSLPTLSPSGAVARVTGTISSNATTAGGTAGQNSSIQGGAGQSGRVYIFGM